MCNDLNTSLMEGAVVQISEIVAEKKTCELAIRNERHFIDPVSGAWKTAASVFPAVVVGPVADACLMYLKKGRRVRVVGRLKQYRWKDKDGHWSEKTCILAEHVEFAAAKEDKNA